MNDVFFCTQHLLRLVMHDQARREGGRVEGRGGDGGIGQRHFILNSGSIHLLATPYLQSSPGYSLPPVISWLLPTSFLTCFPCTLSPHPPLRICHAGSTSALRACSLPPSSLQDLSCGIDLSTEGMFPPADGRPLWFYDSWVARDAVGAMIKGDILEEALGGGESEAGTAEETLPEDGASGASTAAGTAPPGAKAGGAGARARAGLPYRVYCCWNGMVAINAEPLRRGLRIRCGSGRRGGGRRGGRTF